MANRWTPGGRKWPAGRCRLLNIARRDVILTAMSTMELRRRVKQTVDALSADKLKDADRLLRGLRTEDGKIDRDQDGAEAVRWLDLMCFRQADQAADFAGDVGSDMRFRELRAEFFIVLMGRIIHNVVPPDGLA